MRHHDRVVVVQRGNRVVDIDVLDPFIGFRAIDGKPFSWDKLERTATMSKETEKLTAGD